MTAALRVVLVENDADTRRMFTLYLERKGCRVTTAASLADAVETLRPGDADVLIADIGLPDGNGWELLERLRASGIPAPPLAIAMTGFGRRDDFEKSKAAGFQHHLVKPLDTAKLLAILEAARPPA
jgi:CheY-like chemotaxis protein